MRFLFLLFSILFFPATAAYAEVNVGVLVSTPGVTLGINIPSYPRLVRIPGYPVFYDPYVSANYFFYDGVYWVFYDDNWYVSSWYNGPWTLVDSYDVPLFILRIPVRYYRHPPAYFHGWRRDDPPRWGEHWGHDWQQRRSDWEQRERHAAPPPPPAPLPSYQRSYRGDRYPSAIEQQQTIRTERYRYQPREPVTQQIYQRGHGQKEMKQDENRRGRPDERGRDRR